MENNFCPVPTDTPAKPKRSYKGDNRAARFDMRRKTREVKKLACMMVDMYNIGVRLLDRAAGFDSTKIQDDECGRIDGLCSVFNYVLTGKFYVCGNSYDNTVQKFRDRVGYNIGAVVMTRSMYVDGLGERNVFTPERLKVLRQLAVCDPDKLSRAVRERFNGQGCGISKFNLMGFEA